jgi:RNA recognition motif-containing protein
VAQLSKQELDGREINVEIAKPQSGEPKPRKPRKPRTKLISKAGKDTNGDSEDGEIITHAEANAAAREQKKEGKGRRKPRARRNPSTGGAANNNTANTNGAASKSDAEGTGDKPAPRKRIPRPPRKPRQFGEPSKTTVFVANLPFTMDNEELSTIFKDYKVKSAVVVRRYPKPRNASGARSKGFGFVEFETEEEQQRLINSGVTFVAKNRELSIKVALRDEKPTSSEQENGNPADEGAGTKETE